MTEVVQYQPSSDLSAQIEFARMVTSGERGQSILPDVYKGNPANALIAVGLGASMGLSPAEALYRINVIKGKPSAAAELIAANVRRAGHKLRVRVTENPPSATCTIIRSDDPDEPTVITRDMAWAQRMGLANETNYKKQPETMLSYRAITACARLACPEALYGVAYTPDEAREITPEEAPAARPDAAAFLASSPSPAEASVAGDGSTPLEPNAGSAEGSPSAGEAMTDKTRRQMFALFNELDIDEADQRAGIVLIVGHPIESRRDLTETEAQQVITRLKVKKAEVAAGAEPVEPGLFEGDTAP